MGSGSSKAESKVPPKSNKLPPQRPVANVNKQESESRVADIVDKPINPERNLHLSGPIAPIPVNRINDNEGENDKKPKNKPVSKQNNITHNPTALQFEDDSDVDDDIDAVLKIPMANEPLKGGQNKKNKKDKNNDKENIDNRHADNDYNSNYYNQGQNMNAYNQKENDYIPETYAQRLQRQQYKLQQDMLIREKTNIRNLRNWQDEDEDDDENVTPRNGFDASKFRAANKGGDVKTDIFSTVKDDLQTPRYLQHSGQELDEVETNRREPESPNKRLPQYNQSELDLMRQLEEEIL
ncbi:hypothetical protein ElyMa_004900000 [Elysia marginata]|uniref:Uncharacterized protein n=1 Tax=Elysia marginata TaxID=1093978 RepID=A0AAV4IWY0_9GAST|nr:hypothetical protein ElyMa_004900000 [Elysia marginata]